MSVVQDSYSERIGPALVGAPAVPAWDADTRVVETAAGIGFGLACSRGAGERGAILGGSQFAGISLRDITQPPGTGITDEYQENDNIALMTRGRIWVKALADVVAGEDVFYNTTTGGFYNAAGAGLVQIADAVYESSGLTNSLVVVKLAGKLPSAAPST